MRRTAGWTVQALLACCALFGAVTEVAAVDPVSLIALSWTVDAPTACANDTLDGGDIRLLVSVGDGVQTDYAGTLLGAGTCASFADLPPPVSGQTSAYELLVVNNTDEGNQLKQGLTIFTLMGEEITCGESHFVRITSGSVNSSNDAVACLPDASVCYTQTDTQANVCIHDLDPENNPELLVCIPTSVFPSSNAANITDIFEVNTLTYDELSGSFDVSGFDPPTFMMELLSRKQGEAEADLTVSACVDDVCTLEAFTPSSSMYELCGVFSDNATSTVASVGTATFQDIMLKVDTPAVPINFHFVRQPGGGVYEVYHGQTSAFDSGPTVLDCSRVPDNSYCYGVLIEASTYLAVSYTNKTNSVVAPVPGEQSVEFLPKY